MFKYTIKKVENGEFATAYLDFNKTFILTYLFHSYEVF